MDEEQLFWNNTNWPGRWYASYRAAVGEQHGYSQQGFSDLWPVRASADLWFGAMSDLLDHIRNQIDSRINELRPFVEEADRAGRGA